MRAAHSILTLSTGYQRVPPATDHRQELALAPPDGNDDPDGAEYSRTSEKGLIDQCRLNLADIR
jgi:hypothetical protein